MIDPEKTCGKLSPGVLNANSARHPAVLHCWSNLVHYFRGLLMLSGAPRFTCRSGVFLLICVTFLISLSVAAAQQSSGQSSQTAPPAELPAGATGRGGSGECIGGSLDP